MRSAAGKVTRKRHKKILALAKGYRGRASKTYRAAHEAVMKAGMHAYIDRRRKKREFRKLWIGRIGAAARQVGLSYRSFMAGLRAAKVELDRKILADLALSNPEEFQKIVERAKKALKSSV